MAKAVTLKNQNNEEVYPVTDISLVNGNIAANRITDAAVAKVDRRSWLAGSYLKAIGYR